MLPEVIILIVAAVLLLLPFAVLAALCVTIFALIVWLVRAVACTVLAKKSGVTRCWKAFLPFACAHLLGCLAEQADALDAAPKRKEKSKKKLGKKLEKKQKSRVLWRKPMLRIAIVGAVIRCLIPITLGASAGLIAMYPRYWWVALIACVAVLGAGICFGIRGYVLHRICQWKISRLFAPRIAALLLVVSVLIPPAAPLCLLIAALHRAPVRVPKDEPTIIREEDEQA